ncbi:FecR domain-containing protein [Rhodopirellula europaea]|uniref:Protein containing FecR protein domain protein n=1 Tax=Rhodopirellula europaea 6C TaxID=1263867 RepID=M2AP96_9BACT|nr:FecR domain-containing protein [Rhodopirellula europaea]EMB18915.1 protein containing FecR protein domain protein [Rhodopirellula europaea 6C]
MTADEMKPEERIDRYLLGQATAEDVEVLNELLAKDEQLRKLYRLRVALEGGYREAAVRDESVGRALLPVTDETISAQTGRSACPTIVDSRSMLFGFVVAASLAAVALFAITQWSHSDRETPTSGDFTASVNPIARLVASVDADWRNIEPMPGALLEAGSFRLDAGTVELEFNQGARVTLQGPSHFELKSTDLLHVSSGNLVARIPEEAIGFTITTDETEVVDLGTEFGLRVGEDRQTEVHVIEGLVEVFERQDARADGSNKRSVESIRIEEGQAIRWKVNEAKELGSENIPVRSSRGVLGSRQRSDLGLTFLRGNIRWKEAVSPKDLRRQTTSWIEVISEKSGVLLDQDMPITLNSSGNYRLFSDLGHTIPAGTKVDSYLFHFRSTEPAPIRGVIKFDRKIVGLICEANHLGRSDPIVGRDGVEYPLAAKKYRGLEPHFPMEDPEPTEGGGLSADEVTVSKDMKTLGLSVNVNPGRGVDQLRVLVLSKE